MAYNIHQQFPFWNFVRAFDPQRGAGVDHPAGGDFSGFPGGPAGHPHGPPPPTFGGFGGPFGWGQGGFGATSWGGRGRHQGRQARHGRHGGPHGRRGSRSSPPPEGEHLEGEHSEGENSDGSAHSHRGPHRDGSRSRRGHHDAEHPEGEPRGATPPGRRCRGGRRERGHGGRGTWGRHPRGPPPFPGGFDMNGLMAALSSHPLAQTFRNYAEQAEAFGANPQQSGETLVPDDDGNIFVPPIDVFSTEKAYVLHVSLPGAKKEDVGVHWDEDKGVLNVAGVVYRQGDEAFLQTLAQSERKVGMFERAVKLPPGDAEKEEVDGDMITAKLENGVLVVNVPKVEKEWTEVKKVDIE